MTSSLILPLTSGIYSTIAEQPQREKYPVFVTMYHGKKFLTANVHGKFIGETYTAKDFACEDEHYEALKTLDNIAPEGWQVNFIRISGRKGLKYALRDLPGNSCVVFMTEHRELWEKMFRVLNVQAPDSKFFKPIFG